mmetsp:Transcript_27364/g.53799  ORF Transcript_27364/g.53799 Transcript_27364/m.53799 type:complete len:112 (+) Transcript_27364:201-536(+)
MWCQTLGKVCETARFTFSHLPRQPDVCSCAQHFWFGSTDSSSTTTTIRRSTLSMQHNSTMRNMRNMPQLSRIQPLASKLLTSSILITLTPHTSTNGHPLTSSGSTHLPTAV